MIFLSSVSASNKVSNLRRGLWGLGVYNTSVRSTGDCPDLDLASDVGVSCGTEPLTCEAGR